MLANQDNLSDPTAKKLSFDNTEIAFRSMTNAELNRAYWLFKIISVNFLTRIGPPLTNFAMRIGLPIKPLIKSTIFNHFCGGETIQECEGTIHKLDEGYVGSILDYSVEGEEDEHVFDATAEEIRRTIKRADGDERIPFTVFKVTGVGRFALLEKVTAGETLSPAEEAEYSNVKGRVDAICALAHDKGVPIMIDAEETWIQVAIDDLAMEMMRRYNQEQVIVLNTYQMYRNDMLANLKRDIGIARKEGFTLGAKIVRGAYMEKERARAEEKGYPSPINATKADTDKDYNEALKHLIDNRQYVSFVAGTHNEESCRLLASLLDEKSIPHDAQNIYFSQLLGMSDNLSFNLSSCGYNVVKYVPYGPVKAVMPYLFRRAQENTSVAGQVGREMKLISAEKRRRSLMKV